MQGQKRENELHVRIAKLQVFSSDPRNKMDITQTLALRVAAGLKKSTQNISVQKEEGGNNVENMIMLLCKSLARPLWEYRLQFK